MFISTLDILFIVIAIILVPVGTLLSMILWRIYSMMDRADRILNFGDRIVGYATELEKIPMMIINKFLKK